MKSSGYQVFLLYQKIKLHFFNTKYTFDKPIKISEASFNKRNDRKFFQSLSFKVKSKKSLVNFFVTGFLHRRKHLSEFLTFEVFELNKKRVYRIRNMDTVFKKDLLTLLGLCNDINLLYDDTKYGFPLLIKYLAEQLITHETVIILDRMDNFLVEWREKYKDNIVAIDHIEKLYKYSLFFKLINVKKFSECLDSVLTDNKNTTNNTNNNDYNF